MKPTMQHLIIMAVLAAIASILPSAFAQNLWIGTNGISVTTNWSDTANWSTATSPAGTDVVFGHDGAAGVAGLINSVVDANGLDPASITFTNISTSNFFHTVKIPAGVTLGNPGNFLLGGSSAPTVTTTNLFVGEGTFSQTGSSMKVQWIGGTAGGSMAVLDLSGLSNFTYNAFGGTITVASGPSGSEARGGGTLTLAGGSNNITAGTIAVALGTGNGGSGGTLNLGAGTNIINVDTVNVAAGKINNGTIQFAGATGGLRLRGSGGTDSDRANFTLGRRGNTGTGTINGNLLLNDHPVDVLAGTMTLGLSTANVSGQIVNGNLAFNAGTIDANTIMLAVCLGNSGAIANGTVTVGGGLLTVSNFWLVNQTLGVATGKLIITNGGTVTCSGDLVKTNSNGTGTIAINTGTLNVVGALGSVGAPINSLALTNATLGLNATALATANVTALTCGGTTNVINIFSVPIIASYPAQMPLIKYAGALGGTFNIGLGTLPASVPPYAGYISNNSVDGTIDLVLTNGLAPARSLTWSGATDANWDTTTTNWIFSAAPAVYVQNDFVRMDDSATGPTGVNLTTALTPTSVTVSNVAKNYGLTGSGYLSGIATLNKDGSGTLFITNTGINDYTGGMIINAGTVRVGDGAFSGNLGSGAIEDNGTLIFDRADAVTVADAVSGTGSLTKLGTGVLTLSGGNTYSGATLVQVGTLSTLNNTALGSTNGDTTVSSGATLDITANAINLGQEQITISGTGVGGVGALINSAALAGFVGPNAARVTMAGDTTVGGSGRFDLRSNPTSNPLLGSLSTLGQPRKLTKIGGGTFGLIGITVDPALGDIEVQQGIFSLEAAITSVGNVLSNLTVWPGATLQLFAVTNLVDKVITLGGDGATTTLSATSGGGNTIIGPMSITNDCIFNVGGAGVALALNNVITGPGKITKIGAGALTIGGNSPLYGGGLQLNNGSVVLSGTMSNTLGFVVAAGKLTLNGSLLGAGVTSGGLTTIAGSGTATGLMDVSGNVFPGETNVIGTLTAGGLTLQGGAALFYDLTTTNTPGAGTNDLIVVNGDLTVNGNAITVNPIGLLKTGAGNPYRLFNYTGNLIWNADLFVSGPFNYTFAVDTNMVGQVNLIVSGGPPVWNGASGTGDNWSDAANWGGTAVAPNDSLFFKGPGRLTNVNDTAVDTTYTDLSFLTDAGSFTLNGNSIILGGNVINNSTNIQTVNLALNYSGSHTLNGASGPLIIGGGITNTSGLSTLTLAGTGTLTNLIGCVDPSSMTNILVISSNAPSTWTLMDNPSSTIVTNPVQLDVLAGTLNFGTGSSAPKLVCTAATVSRLGVAGGLPATLNMAGGTLTITARLNTGAAGNAIATINQTGGTINLEDLLQVSDSAASAHTTVNVTGGLLNVADIGGLNNMFLASRGTGIVNVAGSGVLNCAVLDMSRNAAGNTLGSVGVVNLDGGILAASRIGAATSAAQPGGTPTATFNFNGGTLKANASAANFIQGNASAPAIPIVSIVKAGGAIIDTTNFNISILEPLIHDTTLGATPDGGLTKHGTGTLTLTAASTYTGNTVISNGTLAVNGSLGVTAVTVGSGGTLAGTGTLGSNVTVNAGGAVSPGGAAVTGVLTVVSNVTLNGIAVMDLNKSTATNDVLRAARITYGGTLSLTNLAGSLTGTDTFKLFSAPVYAGAFAALDPATPGAGLAWNTNTLTTDGILRLTATVNTTPTNIIFSAGGGNLTLTWPGDHIGWTLQVQTNTRAVGLNTNWFNVAGSSATNEVVVPVDPANPTVYYRLVYP